MKLIKDFSRIALVAALACSFALTSCKKDEEETDCGALANDLSVKGQAYAADITSVSNCEAYRTALQAYISGCGSNADAASFQTVLDATTCD